MKNTNRDLLPSNINPGPLDADRVWTICELLCYRARDTTRDPTEKAILIEIANEMNELRKNWEFWNRRVENIRQNGS